MVAVRKHLGWRVIVIWECETESTKRLERLTRRLDSQRRLGAERRISIQMNEHPVVKAGPLCIAGIQRLVGPRMGDITCERLALVKTSGMASWRDGRVIPHLLSVNGMALVAP